MLTTAITLAEIPDLIFRELSIAVQEYNHPFRLFTLGSTDGHRTKLRMVVLRHWDEENKPWIFTDGRSTKIAHFQEKEEASLLFYDSNRQLQVSMQATPILHKGTPVAESFWALINDTAKRLYQTRLAPGTAVRFPEEGAARSNKIDAAHFIQVSFEPKSLEVLQLTKTFHLRASFMLEDGEWKGSWLTP